jgi:hypothetical protein
LFQTRGHELKLVYPQDGVDPKQFVDMKFHHFFLQPLWTSDATERDANIQATVHYCMDHPQWKLGLQIHKTVGLP